VPADTSACRFKWVHGRAFSGEGEAALEVQLKLVTRFLAIAAALALAFFQPDATLAQHAPSVHSVPAAPVYHAPLPVYHPVALPPPARVAAPLPHRVVAPLPHPVVAPLPHPAVTLPLRQTSPPPRPGALQTNRPVIPNPYRWGGWSWNHGAIWYPVPYYWGYGFWGPWGLLATPTAAFGSVVDYEYGGAYSSYGVGPQSPGGQLLYDYGLTQTVCGAANLVVIWGPGNSPICAYSNGLVAAGNYQADPATLTIHRR
jgi:hypothetical protein